MCIYVKGSLNSKGIPTLEKNYFTAWKQEEKNRQTQRKKNLFAMTSGGFVIVVRNKSFIDSK